jgi:trimethylamine--corrinoid protein Co-methyltransferase
MIPTYRLLSRDDVIKIHASALAVLEDTGCLIHSSVLLSLLADNGAFVDEGRGLAKIPAVLVERVLGSAPSTFTLYDREGMRALEMGAGNVYGASGHGAIYVVDLETERRRSATKKDAAGFALLSDALESVAFVAPIVFPQDVPTRASSLHALETIFANTRKHAFFCVDTAEVTRACFDLARIVSGSDDLAKEPRVSFQVSPSSPLMWTPGASDMLIASAEAGVPTCILASAMCGVSAPYTLAGTLALHHAETLSGVVIAQLLCPGLPVIYSTAMSDFGMRRAHALMASPESALLSMASLQLARYCGLPTHTCFPCSESHCHDEQQAWEKVWTTLPVVLAGGDMLVNLGLFAGGLTASYAQVVLDDEIMAGLHRISRGFEVTEQTIALETIRSVGPGGSFLGEPHTLRHLRTGEHWMADISNRVVYDTWVEHGREDVVALARSRARELLNEHGPHPLDDEVEREMRAFVDAYDQSVEG